MPSEVACAGTASTTPRLPPTAGEVQCGPGSLANVHKYHVHGLLPQRCGRHGRHYLILSLCFPSVLCGPNTSGTWTLMQWSIIYISSCPYAKKKTTSNSVPNTGRNPKWLTPRQRVPEAVTMGAWLGQTAYSPCPRAPCHVLPLREPPNSCYVWLMHFFKRLDRHFVGSLGESDPIPLQIDTKIPTNTSLPHHHSHHGR